MKEIQYKIFLQHSQEYSAKFTKAYSLFMRALSDATSKYSGKLPAMSNEYEYAISQATGSFLKSLGDLKGKYQDLSEVHSGSRRITS